MNSSAAIEALAGAVGTESIALGEQIPSRYLRDWMLPMASGVPLALVRPHSTDEVRACVAICHALTIPIVPQGGLTGLVGGATPIAGCVVLSLDRMGGIEEIDGAAATMT